MSPFLHSQPFHLLLSSSLLLLLVFYIPSTANAQEEDQKPIYIDCENTTSYIDPSPFATNLNGLLSDLSSASNIEKNRGFYNNTFGEGSNTIYGQILCRGDSNHTKCHDCIDKARKSIRSNCSSRSAAIWYDTCQLRYSDTNFFGQLVNPWVVYHYSLTNITAGDLDSFKENLGKLMYELAREIKAERWLRNFATREANYADLMIVYGLVQCVPDISATDCYSCLEDSIRKHIRECCVDRAGGRVIGYVCGLRFETTNQFYNESTIADPSPHGKVNIVLILVPAITAVIILALMVALLRISEWRPWRKKDNKAQTAVAQPEVKKETGKEEEKKEKEINVET